MTRARCTKEFIHEAERLRRNGATNKDIYTSLGIGESTFYRWCNEPKTAEQRELGETLKRAEADYKKQLRGRILKAADHTWQAAAWLLERQFPDEYARPEIQYARRAAQEAERETIKSAEKVLVTIRETALKEYSNDGE